MSYLTNRSRMHPYTQAENNKTLLRSEKPILQALSGKNTGECCKELGPARGEGEAKARGEKQDPKEASQQRRGTRGEAPRGIV